MLSRRRVLESSAAMVGTGWALHSAAVAAALDLPGSLPAGTRAAAALEALPGKKPLIRLSYRPPNYETPLEYFRTPITPNDAFFVRYHLSDIPEVDAPSINAKTWKVTVGGDGANNRVQLSLDDIKAMPAHRDHRGLPMLGQSARPVRSACRRCRMGYGAMGCATWKGARLKDVLDKAGLKKEAVEIVLNGADGPVSDKTPDFIKSLPVDVATAETALIAYEMNGQPLPHFNGFPARVIVPGWTGTYWVKHITTIDANDQTVRRLLDEGGLPHSERQISDRRPIPHPADRGQHPNYRNGGEFADHQHDRRRQGQNRPRRGQRRRLGRRLRHPRRRGFHRRRQNLGGGDARPGSRALRRSGRGVFRSTPSGAPTPSRCAPATALGKPRPRR